MTEAIQLYVARNDAVDTMGTQQDAGQLTYICGSGDEQYVGYLFALTVLQESRDLSLWEVATFYSYEALPDVTTQAATILQRMIATYAVDIDWLRERYGYSANTAQKINQDSVATLELIAAALPVDDHRGGETESLINVDQMEVLFAIEDPVTAEEVAIVGDRDFGWIDTEGNILGTDVAAMPVDVNLIELLQPYAD